jgi:hypothetical protein
MAIVNEIAAVIREVAAVVKDTRDIVKAVHDGAAFLAATDPEAQKDFSDLLDQMQRTIEGLARVTSVIGGFRFDTEDAEADPVSASRQLDRFNDYVIRQKEDIATLYGSIRKLKADCEKVNELVDKLGAKANERGVGTMFGLLSSQARAQSGRLQGFLSQFYGADQEMIVLFRQALAIAENGLREVDDALGPPGRADPWNIPQAASILGLYKTLFDEPQRDLVRLADELSEARTMLAA